MYTAPIAKLNSITHRMNSGATGPMTCSTIPPM
jgi:hypothetical protein